MLKELESSVSDKDLLAESVSSANVGWHAEHSLMVINAIVKATQSSNPAEFKKKFSLKKFIIFTLGRIPQKKARAPKAVTPKEPASAEALNELIETTRKSTALLPELDSKKFFKHHIFGNLQLNDTIQFLELHTEHHLKVIRAIKAKS